MENQTFIISYCSMIVLCLIATIGIVQFLSPGLKVFFVGFTRDQEVASFFVKLVKVILVSAGLAGALNNDYVTTEKANWLTLGWDMTDQLESTIDNLWPSLLILAIFLILTHLIDKRWSK